jgi:nucleotide-binding universal stress UspA family protein
LLLGSVADQVLPAAGVPVLLVRPRSGDEAGGRRQVAYHRLLVPLDGSSFAEQALGEARALARSTAATLLLVRVVAGPVPERADGSVGAAAAGSVPEWALADRWAEVAQVGRYLKGQAARLQAAGCAVETEIAYGRPAAALRVVAAQGVDLVVMATHGRRGLQRFWLGSVAHQLVRAAETPLLLVHPSAPAQPAGAVTVAGTAER